MRRVFVVHGWGGHPNESFMPWLDHELTAAGFEVARLAMPHPEHPTIEDWVGALGDAVGTPDTDTHFVGHSIGCQTIMRYLAGLPDGVRVGRVVYVAGWIMPGGLQGLEPDEVPIAQPWLETPLDVSRVRVVAPYSLALFSDDDPVVPPKNVGSFTEQLGAEVLMLHAKGHFSDDSGVTELPEARDFILRGSQ